MSTQNFAKQFDDEYQKLNAGQKTAVNQIEGPVVVIAGPGTGKTQILAARIAKILQTTDSLPENILCLTYTDAGAIAMRKRLLKFIGPDAYRVPIYTFHAFCNLIIQENLDMFGVREMEPLNELEQLEILHEMIDELPKNHLLKRYSGEAYYEAKRLKPLFEIMKREYWSPKYIEQKTLEYLADLPNRDEYIYKVNGKTYKKGELKIAKIEEEKQRMDMLIAAANQFVIYENKLKKRKRYDFADMIIKVIEAFEENNSLLLKYQELYQYFLVDEYQDTSGSQNHLLQTLINYWDSPNVFVVGDDDQSIYRFQGANVENIVSFIDHYKNAGLNQIVLTENYRSSQHILDTAKALIDINQERLTVKTLLAKNELVAGSHIKPEIREYINTTHEAVDIAHKIVELFSSGFPLNEVAVIYRNHSQSEEIIKYLQSKKIPINAKRKADVLQESLIKKIINILRYLAAETFRPHSGEPFLFEIMHYHFFQIAPLDVAMISVETGRKNYDEKKATWREAIKNILVKNKPSLFGQNPSHAAIKKLSDDIEYWIKETINITVLELIEKVITRSGILLKALTGNESTWNMQLLNTFFDFVKQECAKNPKTTLSSLLQTIQLMEENEVSLSIQKISFDENGVNFLTAHGSKGLEFEYVFMLGCNSKIWDKPGRNYTYKLPDNLVFKTQTDETQETRRLFYVGMTRAKQHLCISYATHDANEKELEKSRFVAEIKENTALKSTPIHLPDSDLVAFKLNVLKSVEEMPSPLIDVNYIDQLLQNYALSVTHLNSYLKCPLSFYFNNLLRVPAAKSSAMTFGSAVHYALEYLFKKMLDNDERNFPTVDVMMRDFKYYMRTHEENFTDVEMKRRMEYAEDFLPKYYHTHLLNWNKVVTIERSYRNIVVEGIPLNGKLDKMEFDGNKVNVVDYKTGQFENAKKKFNRPDLEKVEKTKEENKEAKFEDEFGGDYWRQAVFYKILVDNDRSKNWEMLSTEFDFVEPDKQSKQYIKEKVIITSNDVKILKNQIHFAYDGIMNKQFDKGCGKEDCDWCNFVNDYYAGNRNIKKI